MKIWAKTDGEVREGKYLVVRRDGSVPKWPHFVIGGDDHAGPAGLRAYAAEARRLGYDPAYCDSIVELADDFATRAVEAAATAAQLGTKGADPDAGPHRTDCPEVIEMMRGTGDVATLVFERDDLKRYFDLRWSADMRAIKRWQAEAPGRELTLPDHADMVVWLLDRLEEAEARAAKLREAMTPGAGTKIAYMGMFQFRFGDRTPNVPWTCIKKIMAAISARGTRDSAPRPGANIHGLGPDEPNGPNPDYRPPCAVPPEGWACTREAGHEGPCAAVLA